jgi:hypothetical protein
MVIILTTFLKELPQHLHEKQDFLLQGLYDIIPAIEFSGIVRITNFLEAQQQALSSSFI